jgi:hypothetical protein
MPDFHQLYHTLGLASIGTHILILSRCHSFSTNKVRFAGNGVSVSIFRESSMWGRKEERNNLTDTSRTALLWHGTST